MEDADFGGFATKAGLKCTDGRTITPEAFKHMDKVKVPLVWQHGHSDPENVLGHAILEARPDGMYAWGFFNGTKQGQNARDLVQHKDLDSLSIWANQLVEKMIAGSKAVLHGVIREVSIVLAGANPGARIDYVRVQHGDDANDVEVLSDEAIIVTGLTLEHVNKTFGTKTQTSTTELVDGNVVSTRTSSSETMNTVVDDQQPMSVAGFSGMGHAVAGDETVQQIYDSMNTKQKTVTQYMIGKAVELASQGGAAAQSDTQGEGDLGHQEGNGEVAHNVFDQTGANTEGKDTKVRHYVSEPDMRGILDSWKKGGSLKHAVEEYAVAHGITDIDVLFPDARTITDRPEFDKRRTEWVAGVLGNTRKSPFSRIKTITADLTQEAARAKGYIKGNYKKEEWFGVTARVTTPTTIYKKQKLDRDDIVDITDFDVVAWLKMEMRLMLEEEIARAILIGDGRDPGDDDKIKDPAGAAEGAGIRSIVNDHELFVTSVYVNIGDANSDYNEVIEEILRARTFYKGTGAPTLYTTDAVATEMLLLKEANGRRFYNTMEELASALRVKEIVIVEVMEDVATDVVAILVNLADYNIGADRGGEVNLFDDFDIDYNQYKYLIETRISGALTKIKSALVVRTTLSTNVLVHPVTSPTFVTSTGVATIPAQTGVVYKNGVTNATLTAGAQTAIAAGATLQVIAVPASGYYFKTNAQDQWSFTRDAA
jgi:hypothetical protein